MSEFNKEQAVLESKNFIIGFMDDLILHDPESGEEMFLVSPPQYIEEDGSISILCASKQNPDKYIVHNIISAYIDKSEVSFEDKQSEVSDEPKIITPDSKFIV